MPDRLPFRPLWSSALTSPFDANHRRRLPCGGGYWVVESAIRNEAIENMTSLETITTPTRISNRASVARERAGVARAMLADCHLCAHHCGANRLKSPAGLCQAGSEARFFSAQVEVSDELELIPTFAVALSGCDLRCDFCITGGPSWKPDAGRALDAREMAERAASALARGACSVMVLGGEPTIHLPAVLEFVAALPNSAKLVWKTNAHGSAAARALLDGIFDVWLADFKFGNDDCACRLAKASGYVQTARENLRWAEAHSELIVRHLLMPGHVDCCWCRVAVWLAAELPDVKVNLRSGFWPAWRAARHPELCGTVTAEEDARAMDIAQACSLNLVP
jgi:putative pyruvate formate lyase activating enzyme